MMLGNVQYCTCVNEGGASVSGKRVREVLVVKRREEETHQEELPRGGKGRAEVLEVDAGCKIEGRSMVSADDCWWD